MTTEVGRSSIRSDGVTKTTGKAIIGTDFSAQLSLPVESLLLISQELPNSLESTVS